MAELKPKYLNSLENVINREYKIFSTALDIATNIGKLNVLEGLEKDRIVNINCALIKILNGLLSNHTTREFKRGRLCKDTLIT